MATLTAREIYQDFGESLDILQILGQGGTILLGESFNGQMYGTKMATDTITAFATGGQTNAVQLTTPYNRITTVVTAGDSVKLPVSSRGNVILIVNDASANACNVFPAVGEAINALGANTAFSLTVAAGPTLFYCFTAGLWRTK